MPVHRVSGAPGFIPEIKIVSFMKRTLQIVAALSLFLVSCSERQVIIDDFESGSMDKWVVEGNAFLVSPKNAASFPDISGVKGGFFAGSDCEGENMLTCAGQMTSTAFKITRDYINFLLGGTSDRFGSRFVTVELLVDGNSVQVSHPRASDEKAMEWCSWDVSGFKGSNANIRVKVDSVSGRFPVRSKFIIVDHFMQSDSKLSTFNDVLTMSVPVSEDWLLIPSSNSGRSSSLSIFCDGVNILGESQNIMLAGETADYRIPVNVKEYKGKTLELRLTSVDDNDLSVAGLTQSADRGFERDEPYRQVYHFTPDFGWTNDPNGMVYYDGEYHLSYQANPYGTRHSNMHWGHAVSTDLVHWEDLPFIIAPDGLGSIFSGSAVVDSDNTAGFGKDAIIGMYTSASNTQKQSIAYSTDRGRTYTKFDANPVLFDREKQPNFRDPKVIRYGDKWVVCVAAGDVIAFYGSDNLKDWSKLSEFGKGIGSHAAVWECPDLLKLEYGGKEKWVLIVNINPGGPNGGSVAQYFIGSFDGREFKADNLPYPLWVDEGVDNYAGVTFSNTGDRHIFLGWMSNWLYSNSVPTVNFRNGMTLPRDLSLKHNGRHIFLASIPSPEIYQARVGGREVEVPHLTDRFSVGEILPANNGAYEIDFTVVPGKDRNLVFKLMNAKGEEMVYTFDFNALTLNLDRSRSGLVDFYNGFAKTDILTHFVKRNAYEVKVFVDRQSVELFEGDGDLAFTNCMFPTAVYNSMEFVSSDCTIQDLHIYELK